MENKIIKDVPTEIIVLDEQEVEHLDNPNLVPTDLESAVYGNPNLEFKDKQNEVKERIVTALRTNKTRSARANYKKGVQNATKALLDGTYCALTDGSVMSGAEIIAVNIFQRALYSDDSAKLLLKLSGDLDTKEQSEGASYEDFIKNVKPQF